MNEILKIAEKAWFETWESPDAPIFPGNFNQFKSLKDVFLENMKRRLISNIPTNNIVRKHSCGCYSIDDQFIDGKMQCNCGQRR